MTWWGFTSTATTKTVLQDDEFLGKDGERTMITIEVSEGYSIKDFSVCPNEEEILLAPGSESPLHMLASDSERDRLLPGWSSMLNR